MKFCHSYMKNLLFLTLLILLSDCHPKESNKLTIATSANMQFAMKGIIKKFTDKAKIECELIVSSSGKLTAQITEGAPYDVFVSADMKYPEEIYKNHLAAQPPKTYAYGKIVLWTIDEEQDLSPELLNSVNIHHIAIANPRTAPYGEAAVQYLKNTGLFDEVEDKLVYGESISQVNQFILSGTAELGFTSMSTVLADNLQPKGQWMTLNEKLYEPIAQGAVVIDRPNNENAIKFFNFLFSKEAKAILEKYGYSKPF